MILTTSFHHIPAVKPILDKTGFIFLDFDEKN